MAKDDKAPIIIRKKKGGDAHGFHGGAWKVAYADFVTAMMAFFLVMWLMGSDEETKASISKYFNDPTGMEAGASTSKMMNGRNPGGNLTSDEDVRAQNDMTAEDKPAPPSPVHLDEHKILASMLDLVFEGSAFSVDTDELKVKFNVPGAVLFQPGSTNISLQGRRYLAKLASMIKDYSGTVSIAGHADDPDREGGNLSNEQLWQLSFNRALAVRNYLVNSEKVKSNVLLPAAKGNSEKITRAPANIKLEQGESIQRRVEFIFRHERK
ncbi:MAG: flagellar motor protein MotB [Bacteriovoracaceae bacterium]|nr:flagellar motor protein MotB [Bacteriovoracaceae bacterium]